ncbi:MAG TPA: universal stress protein [Acidimicrobiia bacterium]|jgi:nucleotide-binding universal stress UspA family protein
MSHVLITTDGSDLALSAARAAFAIVPTPEKVTILAISEATPELVSDGGGIEGPTMTPAEVDKVITDGNRHADSALLGLSVLVPQGVPVDRILEHGDPGATICMVAEHIGADVIVIGSHGKNWIKRVLLGSVSEYVVHHAKCPVLVVPAPRDREDAPAHEAAATN